MWWANHCCRMARQSPHAGKGFRAWSRGCQKDLAREVSFIVCRAKPRWRLPQARRAVLSRPHWISISLSSRARSGSSVGASQGMVRLGGGGTSAKVEAPHPVSRQANTSRLLGIGLVLQISRDGFTGGFGRNPFLFFAAQKLCNVRGSLHRARKIGLRCRPLELGAISAPDGIGSADQRQCCANDRSPAHPCTFGS